MKTDSVTAPADPDAAALGRWERFAAAQRARTAPRPPAPPGAPPPVPRPACYRLRLCHLEAMPLFQAEERNLEVRLGVTLFDEGAGAFFGATLRGPPVPYEMRNSRGKRGFHVDLDLHAFFHTRFPVLSSSFSAAGSAPGAGPSAAGGSGLSAVAEVVLVERAADGVVVGEYSAGWAAVPLHLPSGAESYPPPAHAPAAVAGSPIATWQSGVAGAAFGGAGAPARPVMHCVPVAVGSPRYLLLRREMPEHAPPPPPLNADGAPCRLHYLFEAWPEMDAWAGLVPPDTLVGARDLIPGLQRCCTDSGLPTRRTIGARSQLSSGGVQPVEAVQLAGLTLRLPEGFLEVVRRTLLPGGGGHTTQGSAVLPLRELQQCLRVRAAVHNGRRFVGPALLARPSALEVVPGGCRGQHLLTLAGDLPLAWLPTDDNIAVVLELLLKQPSSGGGSGAGTRSRGSAAGAANGGGSSATSAADLSGDSCTVLAWGAFVPFRWQPGGGVRHGGWVVAAGPRAVALRSGPGAWMRPQPVLGWRALLERTNRLSPEPPVMAFALQHAEGQGVWPPPATADGVSLVVRPPKLKGPAVEPSGQRDGSGEIRAHRGSSCEDGGRWGEEAACLRGRMRTAADPDAAGQSTKTGLRGSQQHGHRQAKALAVGSQEVQLWQIQAHYSPREEQEQEQEQRGQLQPRSEAGVQAEALPGVDEGVQSPGASPTRLRLRTASCPRLVRAWPALDVAGAVARELAGPEAGDASPSSIRRGVEQRSATKVRLLLEQGGGDPGAAASSGAGTIHGAASTAGGGGPGEELLVQQRVQSEVEAARERVKRSQILRQLQAQRSQVELAEGDQQQQRSGGGSVTCDGGTTSSSAAGDERTPPPPPRPTAALWQPAGEAATVLWSQELQRRQVQQEVQEAQGQACPQPISRSFEVKLPPGASTVTKKVRYTNRQQLAATLSLRTDCPALLRFGGGGVPLALAPGETGHIRMTFDAAGLEGREQASALVYVDSSDSSGVVADCFRVTVRR